MANPPDYGASALGGPAPRDGRPPRGVVAVLLRDDRFLLVRRGAEVRAAGWWCFPGGGLDAGETELEALVREIREELGIVVMPRRHLWRAVTAWGVDLSWWQVAWDPRPGNDRLELDPVEIAEIRWLRREEVLALDRLLGSNLAFFEHGVDARLER